MSNTSDLSTPRIAVVVSGWPRLSESFALNELLAMRRAGMLAAVFATKRADATHRHPAVVALDDLVHHLGVVPAEEQAAEIVGVLGGLNIANINGVHGCSERPATGWRSWRRRMAEQSLRCTASRGDSRDLLEWTAPTDVSWERWSTCP